VSVFPPPPRLNPYRTHAIVLLVIYITSVIGVVTCHLVKFPYSYVPAAVFTACAILALYGIMYINVENSR
jgi:hypothetical protein